MTKQDLETIEINPHQPAKTSIIWLHGLGADGHDFANIVPQLNLPQNMAVRFIFPHAPIQPITINFGAKMRAWFDIHELSLEAPQDKEGIQKSHNLLKHLINKEISRGIPSQHIVLAGFSQGGAMALQCGLCFPQKLAGILVLSGFLPLAEQLVEEASNANKDTPILMLHGEYDDVIPITWAKISRDKLINMGFLVKWLTYSTEHNVCFEEIQEISKWLQNLFVS